MLLLSDAATRLTFPCSYLTLTVVKPHPTHPGFPGEHPVAPVLRAVSDMNPGTLKRYRGVILKALRQLLNGNGGTPLFVGHFGRWNHFVPKRIKSLLVILELADPGYGCRRWEALAGLPPCRCLFADLSSCFICKVEIIPSLQLSLVIGSK